MIIAIFPSLHIKQSKKITEEIISFFHSKKVSIVCDDESAKDLNIPPISSIDPNDITFLLTMGGDGTIIRIAHQYANLNRPILGINLGHLGFMADVPLPDIIPSMQDLLDGKYEIEKRMTQKATFQSGKEVFSINDIVVHRARNPSLIELSIHVDGSYLNTFEADGIIVATPNGSTAYSLAAGGPILSPKLEACVITPISAHTISNRPIVIPGDVEIKIQYLSSNDPVEVICDGIDNTELQTGGYCTITKNPNYFKLVSLHRKEYFQTLRSKLNWAGKLR